MKSNIQIVANSSKDALCAYAAIVAKNRSLNAIYDSRLNAEKASLAIEAAHIYESDLRPTENDWLNMPLRDAIKAIQGADVTDAAVGTLAGTLVLQRTLPLFKYQYPILNKVFTDFSAEQGQLNQTSLTRIVVAQAVQTYDTSLDANGRPKGWIVKKPAQTIDVPITLDEYVGVQMIFSNAQIAGTVRSLFGEQTEMAINTLAGYFVSKICALMTPANFNAYKGNSATGGETASGTTTIVVGSTENMYPGQSISGTGIPTNTYVKSITDSTHAELTQAATATNTGLTFTLNGGLVPDTYSTYQKPKADFALASLDEISAAFDTNKVPYTDRFALLNSAYYNRLRQDPALNMFFAAQQNPDIITKGALPELTGFAPMKAPYFPTANSAVGFAGHRGSIALKSRLPMDFSKAVDAPIPGTITTVTDPESNLSLMLVEHVDLTGNYAVSRIEGMIGAAAGDRRGGLVITSE